MPLEVFDKISDLNVAWPDGDDGISSGDDHIRGLKYTFQQDVVSKQEGGTYDAKVSFADGADITGTLDVGGTTTIGGNADVGARVIIGAGTAVGTPAVQFDAQGVNSRGIYAGADGINMTVDESLEARVVPRTFFGAGLTDIVVRETGDARYTGNATDMSRDMDVNGRTGDSVVGETLINCGRDVSASNAAKTITFRRQFRYVPAVTATALQVDRHITIENVTRNGFDVRSTRSSDDSESVTPAFTWIAVGEANTADHLP